MKQSIRVTWFIWVYVVFFIIAAPYSLLGQSWEWLDLPGAAETSSMVSGPTTVESWRVYFCNCGVGLFSSVNAGLSWQEQYGLDPFKEGVFDVWPNDAEYVLFTQNDGLGLYSLDGGITWGELPTQPGASDPDFRCINVVFDRWDPTRNTLLAAGVEEGPLPYKFRTYRSTNGGLDWQGPYDVMQDNYAFFMHSLASDPYRPDVFYLTRGERYFSRCLSEPPPSPPRQEFGIFRSANGGVSWERIPDGPEHLYLSNTAITSSYLYASQGRGMFFPGADILYRYNIQSEVWEQFPNIPAAQVIRVDPNNTSVLYLGRAFHADFHQTTGGIYRIEDLGTSFDVENISGDLVDLEIHAIEFEPGTSNHILAGTGSGIFYTSDGGNHWEQRFEGIHVDQLNSVAVKGPHINLTLSNTGSVKTWDPNTDTWPMTQPEPFQFTWNGKEIVNGEQRATLRMTHFTNWDNIWLFGSADGGVTWDWEPVFATTCFSSSFLGSCRFYPNNQYFAYRDTDINLELHVIKSTDGGATWPFSFEAHPNSPNLTSMRIAPSNPDYCLLGFGYPSLIRGTSNGGTTWEDRNGEPGSEIPSSADILSLAIDPVDHQVILAATNEGVYNSEDWGSHWTLVNSNENDLRLLTEHPLFSDVYYAMRGYGSGDKEILRTVDGGQIWIQLGSISFYQLIDDMDITSTIPSDIYLPLDEGIVKYSDDVFDGIYTGDYVWRGEIHINRSVTVSSGTISILPSTMVRFAPGISLNLSLGILEAIGEEGNPITFTGLGGGTWDQINVAGGEATFEECTIQQLDSIVSTGTLYIRDNCDVDVWEGFRVSDGQTYIEGGSDVDIYGDLHISGSDPSFSITGPAHSNWSHLYVAEDVHLDAGSMSLGAYSSTHVHGHILYGGGELLFDTNCKLAVDHYMNVPIEIAEYVHFEVGDLIETSESIIFSNDTLLFGALSASGQCTLTFSGGTYLEIDSLYTTANLIKFDSCSGTIGWLIADTSAHIEMTPNCDVDIETGFYLLDSATVDCDGVTFTDIDSGIVVSCDGEFDNCTFRGTDVVQTGGDLDIDSCTFENSAYLYLDEGGKGVFTDVTDCDFDDGYLWMKKPYKTTQTIDHCVFQDQSISHEPAAYFTDGSVTIEDCGFYDVTEGPAIEMDDCDSDISTTWFENCGPDGFLRFSASDAQMWCNGIYRVDGIGIHAEQFSEVTLRQHDSGKPPSTNWGRNEIYGKTSPTNVVKLLNSASSKIFCEEGENKFGIDTSEATAYFCNAYGVVITIDVGENEWFDLNGNGLDSTECAEHFSPNWTDWWNPPLGGPYASCISGYRGRLDEGGTPVTGTVPILFHEGLVAVQESDYEEAFAKFREVIEDYPEHELATSALKRLFWAARDNDRIVLEEESGTLEMPAVLDELEGLRNSEGALASFARLYVPQAKVAMEDYEGALEEYRDLITDPESDVEEIHARIDSQRIALYITGATIASYGVSRQLREAREAVSRLRTLRGLRQRQSEMLAGLNKEKQPPTTDEIAADEELLIPDKYELQQAYPNPFNSSTVIKYSLPEDVFVSLSVFNILGQKVATLVDKPMTAGFQSVTFDASHLSTGVYIYRIEAGSFVDSKKMVLIK